MNETHDSSLKAEPFSAAKAVTAGIDFAELQLGKQGLFWNEYRPQDAACRIWHWRDGQAKCLTPPGFSVRSRVYEYGGGAFCLTDDGIVFVNEADQQLYRQSLMGETPEVMTSDECRYGDLRFANGQILAVEEHRDQHRLVAIDLADGVRHLLAEGADFYASPTLSADARRLAWIEWSRPDQPWTTTRLMVAERQDESGFGQPRCVAGGRAPESVQQPRFDANGRLYCLTDRDGFWQPWVESTEGLTPLPSAAADHGPAPWQLGGCTWLPLNDNTYLASWTEDGFGRLGLCGEAPEDFTGDYSRFRSLAFDEQFIYCIAASPVTASAVIAIDRNGGPSLTSRQSAVRFIRGKATCRVHRSAKLAQGLGADQQRIVEAAAVGEINLDRAFDVAQAQFQINHRTLGRGAHVLVVFVFFGAGLDLADPRDLVLVDLVARVLGAETEAHPVFAITGEGFDVLGRQRRGQGAGVHLGLEDFTADFRQRDVFVTPVQGRLGGHDRQGHEGQQCKEGFHVMGFLGELGRIGRILDRKKQ